MQLARSTTSSFSLLTVAYRGPGQSGLLGALKQAMAERRAAARERATNAATVAALAELDDASLADIGLHRSQIASVAANLDDYAGHTRR